eukprot:GHVQ01010610.1.p1 GENE.GHVQ01010610.1~~GHVQ01010610.1.p1  ORF type:complete len:111 (-),score=2.44 GHVQ01010610.1:39-371(-)
MTDLLQLMSSFSADHNLPFKDFLTIYSASSHVSSTAMPIRQTMPGPIFPTTSPFTLTEALRTRCRTNRIMNDCLLLKYASTKTLNWSCTYSYPLYNFEGILSVTARIISL